MCIVSMIIDQGRTLPQDIWDRPKWDEFNDLIKKTRKIDDMLGQKDCEDPEKAKWMREVEERLKKLEER